jgi:hypothetical protein
MGLSYDFKAAKKRLDKLDAEEREDVLSICREIYDAEKALTEKASPILARCMVKCKGLCCQNIIPADIITEWDLLYILFMAPQVEKQMADCLKMEDLFSQKCIFLANNAGPCIFPDNIRPERCIISFCSLESSVEKEIAQVMKGFSRLIRYFMFRPVRRMWPWKKKVLCTK